MEAGTHSIWISEQIRDLGHEVIVANVRELRAISHSDRKSDSVDAEKLARYARLDPEILRPIAHRTVAQQETLTLIRGSADKAMRMPLSKQRNKHIQRTLVEAAKLAPRQSHELAVIYEREKQKGNSNRATLAVARKMVAICLPWIGNRETLSLLKNAGLSSLKATAK